MTQRMEHLELMLSELERYGLKGEVSDRGKHLEVAWVSPLGRRFVIAPRTPSDWRSALNCRSDIRRMLRADNLQPKSVNELSFQKAMTLPKQPLLTQEQVANRDIEALTDLVFDMQAQIAILQEQNIALADKMNSITVVSTISFAGQAKPDDGDVVLNISRKLYDNIAAKPAKAEKKVNKTEMVLGLLSTNFRGVKDLIRESKITRAHVNNILQVAKRKGLVENGLRGEWRKK